jgi:acetyl esterase/lipase
MASVQSQQIRAALAINKGQSGVFSVLEQRQNWEAAAVEENTSLPATVVPVDSVGLKGEWVKDEQTPLRGGALLYLHGGGYNAGSSKTHRKLGFYLSRHSRLPVLLLDYRLAPEHPFPAAIEDTTRAYHYLLESGLVAEQIVVGGDSAGGGLALASLLKLREEGRVLPIGCFMLSPWVDLALSGASLQTHAQLDPLASYEALKQAAYYYLGEVDPKTPLASPLYGELEHLPPLLILVGEYEVLLSDATRLAEKVKSARGKAQLEVWEGMWHVWPGWVGSLPEAEAALVRIGEFVSQCF